MGASPSKGRKSAGLVADKNGQHTKSKGSYGAIVQGEGVFLGNPEDSGREDWGTLGKIREDHHPLETESYYKKHDHLPKNDN